MAHVSQCGIMSQIETHLLCSLVCASVRRPARHAGPRLVQLLFMIGISGGDTLMFLACLFLAREEAFGVERLLLAQEVIHRAADLRFQHR